MNAVVNSYGKSLEGCIIYVSLFPCNECAKLLIQSGKATWYCIWHAITIFIFGLKKDDARLKLNDNFPLLELVFLQVLVNTNLFLIFGFMISLYCMNLEQFIRTTEQKKASFIPSYSALQR